MLESGCSLEALLDKNRINTPALLTRYSVCFHEERPLVIQLCFFRTLFPFNLDPLLKSQESPQVTVPKSRLLVGLGQTAVMECTVTGIPHPELLWYKGEEMPPEPAFTEMLSVT